MYTAFHTQAVNQGQYQDFPITQVKTYLSDCSGRMLFSHRKKNEQVQHFVILELIDDNVLRCLAPDGEVFMYNISRRTHLPMYISYPTNVFMIIGTKVYIRCRYWQTVEVDPYFAEFARLQGKPLEELFSPSALQAVKQTQWAEVPFDVELVRKYFAGFVYNTRFTSIEAFGFACTEMVQCAYSHRYTPAREAICIEDNVYADKTVLTAGIDVTCVDCGETFKATTKELVQNKRCPACQEKLPHCRYCSRAAYKTIDKVSVCQEHSRLHSVGKYHSNSSREDPKFEGEFLDNFKLYLGVELEVDQDARGSSNRPVYGGLAIACAHTYMDETGDELEFTNDGSLSNGSGFEMISHPKTIDAWHKKRSDWAVLFKRFIKAGVRGHDAACAGFHVHVSRAAFKDEKKAFVRMQVLMHRHLTKVLMISRRTERRMHDYAYPVEGMQGIAKFTPKDFSILKYCHDLRVTGHHLLAVDGSVPTFEFRIFRSTLNIETFMATLDFVYGVCRYADTHSFDECNEISWEQLKEYINSADFNAYETRIMEQAKKPLLSSGEVPTSAFDIEGEVPEETVAPNMTAAGHSVIVSSMAGIV